MESSAPGGLRRTLICSVVFVDIVEYSKKTVAKQLAIKSWFNELLGQALTAINENNVKTQESIASAAESITTMQLMYTPPEADDIAQAVVRTLREN